MGDFAEAKHNSILLIQIKIYCVDIEYISITLFKTFRD